MAKKQIHKCGTCDGEYGSEKEYLAHTCTTGYKPATVEHLDSTSGGRFSLASAAALKRGEARKK